MRTQIYLTPADHGRALSWEEFARADAEEGYRYEMIEGRVFVSPVPGLPHDDIVEWLKSLFLAFSQQHPELIGRVKGPARVFLPERLEGVTAPEPDVACYADYPSDRPKSERNWRAISPFLVVEILSEDNQDKDLERNCRLYLEVASIREYWILDPLVNADRPSLIVYRGVNDGQRVASSQRGRRTRRRCCRVSLSSSIRQELERPLSSSATINSTPYLELLR